MAIAGAVSLGLGYWLARLPRHKIIEALGLSLVLGGALGNLYDRVTLGYVVDFYYSTGAMLISLLLMLPTWPYVAVRLHWFGILCVKG